MSNKQKRIGICIYCGLQKKITSDHIPPKKIFKKPLPNNLITVDCCSKCNSGFSKDDEEFKRLIWSAKGADKHEAFDNKTDEIIRSINRPTAIAYKHKVINSMKNAEIYSENRIYLGIELVVKENVPSFDNSVILTSSRCFNGNNNHISINNFIGRKWQNR